MGRGRPYRPRWQLWLERHGRYPLLSQSENCQEPEGHIPPHSEYAQQPDNAAAIGGFVYHGTDIPELDGWYVFGDFLRPRIFAVHPDFPGAPPEILYEGPEPFCACLTGFGETPDGELLVIMAPRGDDPGGIFQLAVAD